MAVCRYAPGEKERVGAPGWGPASEVFEALAREDRERWDTELYSPRPGTSLLIATPLMVDGVLFWSTPLYQAAAVDARTGETLWVYDPKAYESGTPAVIPWRHRGVAYWSNDDNARIVWATGDGFLIAVDAETGRPAADFGDGGRIGSHGRGATSDPRRADCPESSGTLVAVTTPGAS